MVNKINFVASLVRKSKKFRGLNEGVVVKEVLKRVNLDKSLKRIIEKGNEKSLSRNSKVKGLVKDIRGYLFKAHGAYYKKKDKKYEYLRELRKKISGEVHKKILHCHSSSRERLDFYGELYSDIFKITGKPKKISDLGCGLNPVSFPFMRLTKIDYIASDFDEESCKFVKEYFSVVKKKGVNGKVFCLDLCEKNNLNKLPKVDVCFLFKVADVIERKGHKKSEDVVKNVRCKFIVVSFSTKTLSGKKMRKPGRKWFEVMLNRVGYSFEVLEYENEVFYVVNKN